MSYDNVIANVGNFGRHQRRVLPVLLLPAIACAFHKMGGTFLAAKADFRCLLPNENPENATYQLAPDTENLTHLWNGTTKMWPQCEIPNQDISDPNHTMEENTTSMFSTVKCDWFVYDKTYYTQTVTTEVSIESIDDCLINQFIVNENLDDRASSLYTAKCFTFLSGT